MKRGTQTSGLFLTALIIFISPVYGQNEIISLTFTANFQSEYMPLDSILFQNLTQGGDTILHWPDTVLVLDIATGLSGSAQSVQKGFDVSQNIPNPFSEMTTISLFTPEKGYFEVTVRNIMGQSITTFTGTLEAGDHLFTFNPSNDKFYLLTASSNGINKSIKMMSTTGSHMGDASLVYSGMEYTHDGYKSQSYNGGFVFATGDQLRFIGYAATPYNTIGNNEMGDSPQTSQTYNFDIIGGIRCPGMPTVTDIDGNVYNTVVIGTQCWMKENLKTTTYKNGTPIPNVTDAGAWSSLTSGAYVWYNNQVSWKEIYGALYNWFTTVDPNGNKLKSCRQVNSPLGIGCSTSEHPRWLQNNANYGTDEYGFSGIPGGYRYITGTFNYIGSDGIWWSSTGDSAGCSYLRYLGYNNGSVGAGYDHNRIGVSVRCLRN